MPQDCIIINPKQPGCTYPFKDLAGVGLAFKLSQAIEESKDKYLDLAAFGTVADIVPLLDENRLIVHFGLRRMTNTENIGLRELIDVSKISGKDLVPYHIGFILGPRMNAAGRLGEARRGLELLLAQEKQKANQAALELDEENNNRKKIEAEVLEDALRKVSKHIVLEENNIIVLYGAGWHLGVVGIVASKLAARFYRPVILLSGEKEAIRGSGRSIGEFNIYNAIEYCKEHLIEFGGHAYAAGLSMKQECFEKFEKMINEYASRTLSKDDLVAPIVIDSVIDIQDISFKLVTEIERLAPFGTSNLRPVFLSEKVRIKSEPQLLKKEHVKLWVSRRHEVVEIIGFNMGMRYRELLKYREIDIVYTISINEWRGQKSIQLQLKDFRPS